MAYSSPSTRSTGYVVTAANWNQLVNNFLASAPDVFTTNGDVFVASGADAGVRIAAFTSSTGTLKHEIGGMEFDASAVTTNDAIGGASSGVFEIKTPVTQGEAEGGTNTRFSLFSSLRVAQAIAALGNPVVNQATQAQLETETDLNAYAPPDMIRYSPGVTKGYLRISAGGCSFSGAYNVAGVCDQATGRRVILWCDDFSSEAYSVVNEGHDCCYRTKQDTFSAASFRLIMLNTSGYQTDIASSTIAAGEQVDA